MSSRLRWAGWAVLAALLGVGLALLLDMRPPPAERVLARAPADASIVAYAELDPLRKSAVLGKLVRQRLLDSSGISIVEPDIDAIAVAVGPDEIVGLAAGRFALSLIKRYLEQLGANCPAALGEQACALPGAGGGYLSIRGLGDGLVGVTNGPRADAADRLSANETHGALLAAQAETALARGALIWISIDPRKLADTMSDPPQGWINLSLVARALLSAQRAAILLRDSGGDAVEATLEATCGSAEDATELSKMLESLNELAATALRSGRSETNHDWARALDEGFSTESRAADVTARWLIPESLVEQSLASSR